ncbi:hypothetical protein FQV27_13580 [Paracoccus aurantiacus]|uniref:glucan 1,4-alpha-glucosidase n=1 Tax=Paracoccus aurantiacus TaxID=2599412 RepID=A0A5C6S1C6_9RHOB|nr:glycoside hydrolase family 15 protein [Paracoccus aurantiacus]TXB68207.1 hypothetical protein FQV27_13580 [Paracoccus aurantiacus]
MPVPDADWIAARCRSAAGAMKAACSATHLVRNRDGFGWVVRPAPGSVLASTRIASWQPEPDYFHHWVRDSAIVLRAVPLAVAADPASADFWRGFVSDFIDFSLVTTDPERHGPAANPLKSTASPSHAKFLRPDAELAALHGPRWLEEPRLSADGSPDLEQWGRPQDDGPALRASALMSLIDAVPEAGSAQAEAMIARDLAHLLQVAGRPCIGPWEEWPPRRCSFTVIVQWDALERGSRRGKGCDRLAAKARELAALLEMAADPETGGWRESIEADAGTLDAATCLAILHAHRDTGPFAMTAPRTAATAAGLERIFAGIYPINRDRSVPAIGRWESDVYFDGNPWYPTTLGFAALHYRIAALTGDASAFAKADGWMSIVQHYAPDPDTPLPEQFDRRTGAPTSCLNLTWSAAAFLEAAAARDAAIQATFRIR